MMNNELKDSELEQVLGGKLTEEAQTWINANKTEILSRAKKAGLSSLANYALNYVQTCSEVIDLATVKIRIGQYIDISDL